VLGRGALTRVTREQIFGWNPEIIIAQQRSFYDALQRSSTWRGLAAVRSRKVYLAPADPFGWIDDPPGVNRTIGLHWLLDLFYPDLSQQDLRAVARDFYQLFYGVQLTDRQVEALIRPATNNAVATSRLATVPILGAEPPPMPDIGQGEAAEPPTLGVPGRGGLRNKSGQPSAPTDKSVGSP
jgi:hypothetical protein